MSIQDGVSGELTNMFTQSSVSWIFDGTNWLAIDSNGGDLDTTRRDATSFGARAWAHNGGTAYGQVARASTAAVGVGDYATASGTDSVAIGKNAEATIPGSIAIGASSDAKSTNTVSIGDKSNATVSNCTAVGGNSSATDTGCTAVGAFARAQDDFCTSLGYNTNSRGQEQKLLSAWANGERWAEIIHACDETDPNTRIKGGTMFHGIANSASPVELFPGTNTIRWTMLTGSTMTYRMLITARDSVTENIASYELTGIIDRTVAGTVSEKGTQTLTVMHEDDAAWDIYTVANDTTKALEVFVLSDTGNDVVWTVGVDFVETLT